MDTVPAWLAAIGLERYASTFESHGVDPRSLPLLIEADLAEMGVLLGHRKLLLKAIEALSRPATAMATEAVRDAERRQLTVLFCDLVGSTALSHRLDPEVLRDVMRDYQKTCSTVIERYAGHVAQFLGDGLVVYFGYPDAHEDDAERGVRAALEIVPAVQQIANGESLQVKVGIATGPVVVGKNEDGDPLLPNAAVGETPNIAARLQDVAAAGQIVIAPSTYRLLGDTFEIEDLGEYVLKGIIGPSARLIRGLRRSGSRFDATRAGRYTPLIGREQEVALLLSRWEQASEGEGQTVLLAGEPGIGKSRIVEELRERLAQAPQIRLQCSPLHAGSAFYPFIERLEREAGFERSDTPQRKIERLEAMLEFTGEDVPTIAPLYAELLSLPTDRYPSRVVDPQRRHELTVAALADQAFLLASKRAVLVICEDVHWIDPSSLETLSSIVERVHRAAILLVVTHRSEFALPWVAHGNVTALNLNRLSRRHGAAMMRRLTGDKPLPDELLAKILDRTDGVPLFVEELTRDVLDGGLLHDAGDRYELRSPLPELAIPSTLKDSLMARLDRLASAKEVAQIGACIGREFGEGLLTATGLLPKGS